MPEQERYFQCTGCGGIFAGEDWNSRTIEAVGNPITFIENNINAGFTCPGCGEWRTGRNGEIIELISEEGELIKPMARNDFKFGLDESFSVLERCFSHVTGKKDCSKGVAKVRELWTPAKERLFALMGPTGRLEGNVEYSLTDDAIPFIKQTCRDHITSQAEKQGIPAELRNSALYFVSEYLFNQHFSFYLTAVMVATNKLGEERKNPLTNRKLGPDTKVGKYVHAIAQHMLETRFELTAEQIASITPIIVESISMATSSLKTKDSNLTVVLSCNPLDLFLTSEATNGWGSCHNWHGCHRTGTLAYMLDQCSLVAYAYKRHNLFVPANERLPEKLWRQMVYTDLDHRSAILSREYTEQRPSFAKAVRRLVAKVLCDHANVPYDWKVLSINGRYTPENAERGNVDTCMKYNQLGWYYRDSPTYRLRLTEGGTVPEINVGVKELPCIVCGEIRRDNQQDTYMSFCCDGTGVTCVECGQIMRDNERYRTRISGEIYCHECRDEHFFRCSGCHSWHRKDETEHEYVEDYGYYCKSCYDELWVTCEHCDEKILEGHSYVTDDEVTLCRTCLREHTTYCGECGERFYHADQWDSAYITDFDNTEPVCPFCRTTHVHECTECGELFHSRLMNVDNSLCDNCEAELNSDNESEVG